MSKGEMLPNGHGPIGPTKPVAANPGANAKPVRLQRRHSAKQLYRRYVNKSNLFAQSGQQSNQQATGRWQNGGQNGAPFRLSDSAPTAKQLQWQTQRRANARQLAMNTSGGLHGPKIVQRHAEMRAYLLHCQRVLNARPVVDTGRLAQGKSSGSSSLTSPSVADAIWDENLMSTNRIRARSVPANARRREMTEYERELQEENRRLLERLVQISTRSPSESHMPPDSRQSTSTSSQQRSSSASKRRPRE